MAGRVSLLTGALALALSAGFDWPTRTERLLDQLAQHSDAAGRADLVRLLSELRDARAHEALLILARDAQPNVRAEALRGLTAHGNPPSVEPFTRALTDEDAAVRAQAAAALGRLRAREAAPALTRLLGDADTAVRVAAARALGEVQQADSAAALAAALDDATLEVRMAAAHALSALRADEAFDVLLAKLRDPTPELRIAVVEALPQIDPRRAQTALREALFDPSESVIIAALRALHLVPPPYALELAERLQILTEHPHERVASAAHLALERAAPAPSPAGSEQGWLPALERSAEVTPDQEGVLLRDLEARLAPGEALAVDPLRLWLDRAQPPYRGRIAQLIARARPRSAAGLIPFTRDRDPEVRRAIVLALGTSGDATAIEALSARLADRDAQVAEAAAHALARVAVPQTLDVLAGRLQRADPADSQRLLTARALAFALERLGPDLDASRRQAVSEPLVDLLRDRDPGIAALAARGLGGLSDASAHAALLQAAVAHPALVRVAVLRASAADQGEPAQRVRRAAANDPDPRVATTAWVAQWRAGDRLDLALLRGNLQGSVWPLGPVAAFLLASLERRALDPALACAALSFSEPLTRANALAALTRAEQPVCAKLADVPTWLGNSRVWPLRLAAAHWLQSPHAPDSQGAIARCVLREPHDLVRAACATPEAGSGLVSARDRTDAYRALVLADGRVLVSAADAAGEVRWPGVPYLAAENPWQWGYGQE